MTARKQRIPFRDFSTLSAEDREMGERNKLNGEVVNDVPLDHKNIKTRPATGFIGFQDHGLPLWLRNIKVREL